MHACVLISELPSNLSTMDKCAIQRCIKEAAKKRSFFSGPTPSNLGAIDLK